MGPRIFLRVHSTFKTGWEMWNIILHTTIKSGLDVKLKLLRRKKRYENLRKALLPNFWLPTWLINFSDLVHCGLTWFLQDFWLPTWLINFSKTLIVRSLDMSNRVLIIPLPTWMCKTAIQLCLRLRLEYERIEDPGI